MAWYRCRETTATTATTAALSVAWCGVWMSSGEAKGG